MLEQVGRVEHRHEDCFGQELWRSPGQAEDWWILVIEESGEMPVEPSGFATIPLSAFAGTSEREATQLRSLQADATLRVDAWLRRGVKGR